jgi:inhibitor of growth protein 3
MTSDPAALSTANALTLLSEYTQSLDSLPADVSRQFADLRELDAVLSASVHALTTKMNRLVDMIESNSSPKEQRIWLLMEIADEAQRLKLGGEDKIRVAAQVADFLKVQNENMTSLLLHIPAGFNRSILSRHTSYPHISPRSYAPTSMYETGRRRRGALLGSTATDQTNPSNKRRRAVPREDDGDPVAGRTPRRDRVGDNTNSRSRNGARSRRFVNRSTGSATPGVY